MNRAVKAKLKQFKQSQVAPTRPVQPSPWPATTESNTDFQEAKASNAGGVCNNQGQNKKEKKHENERKSEGREREARLWMQHLNFTIDYIYICGVDFRRQMNYSHC